MFKSPIKKAKKKSLKKIFFLAFKALILPLAKFFWGKSTDSEEEILSQQLQNFKKRKE